MKKKLAGISAAVISIAVLFAVLLMLGRVDNEAPVNTSTAVSAEDISSVTVYLDSERYTVTRTDTDGDTTFAVSGYADDLKFNDMLFYTLFYDLSAIPAEKVIEQPGALEIYGLQFPNKKAIVTGSDGGYTINIGDSAAFDSGFYASVEGDENVYILSGDTIEKIFRPITYYRDITVADDYYLGSTIYFLTNISIKRPNMQDLPIQALKLADENGNINIVYATDTPATITLDKSEVESTLLEPLAGLSQTAEIVEDYPSDTNKYGFSTPYAEISLANEAGQTAKILIGDLSETKRYIMREDIPCVLSVEDDELDFIFTEIDSLFLAADD